MGSFQASMGKPYRALFVSLAVVSLGLILNACGNAHSVTTNGSGTGTNSGETAHKLFPTSADADHDDDVGAPDDDTNNNSVLTFGSPAPPAERAAIVAVVKRYYATALAGNGAKGCAMLYSTLAENVVEDYGHIPGPLYVRGSKTCAELMSRVFSYYHAVLAAEIPKLTFKHVLLNHHHAMVVMAFGSLPERELPVSREGRVWRVSALIDGELP